jgi:hypothetical protein
MGEAAVGQFEIRSPSSRQEKFGVVLGLVSILCEHRLRSAVIRRVRIVSRNGSYPESSEPQIRKAARCVRKLQRGVKVHRLAPHHGPMSTRIECTTRRGVPRSHCAFSYRDRAALCAEGEAETHVFAEPLDVIGAPSVVEEAEMEALSEVGLGTREVDG